MTGPNHLPVVGKETIGVHGSLSRGWAAALVAALALATACTATAKGGDPATGAGAASAVAAPGTRAGDSLQMARLEASAKAIAKTTGCSSDDQCRNAAVGIKPCGGTRYYLKYCAASTDTVALLATIDSLDQRERAFNKKYNVVSNCMLVTPTRPHLEGGACR